MKYYVTTGHLDEPSWRLNSVALAFEYPLQNVWLGAGIDGYFDKWMSWWYSTHISDVNLCEHSHYRLLSIMFLSAVRSTALSLTLTQKHSNIEAVPSLW